MTKRIGKKFASLLLSAVLLLGLMPTAAFAMSAGEESDVSSPYADLVARDISNSTLLYADENGGSPEGLALNLDKDSLIYLESYASMLQSPIGAVGFEDEYEPGDDAEMVDIIVTLDTLPSAILPIYAAAYSRTTISEAMAERIVETAVNDFVTELDRIDNGGNCDITSTLTYLGCTVNMTVPAYMVAQIAALDGVFAVTPDYIVYADSTSAVSAAEDGGTPANSVTSAAAMAWDSSNVTDYSLFTGFGMKQSRETLRINELNNEGYTGAGIKVGILDSGVDYNHPDLYYTFDRTDAGNIRQDDGPAARSSSSSLGYDFVDNDTDPNETTYQMWLDSNQVEVNNGNPYYTTHGTHVAGTVGARGDNNSTYAALGIAPEVQLMAYRVLGPYGSGSTSNINAAVERAYEDGCDVINMSLGGSTSVAFDPNAAVLNNAILKGMVICVSAGNNGPDSYTIGSPGIAYLAITVGAAQLGGTPYTSYQEAVSVSEADGSTKTKFDFMVEGHDPAAHGFVNNAITGAGLIDDGNGYEYVLVVAADGGATTPEQLAALADGSLAGKILVLKRGGMNFVEMQDEAKRLGAGAFVVINSDSNEGYITGTSISGMSAGVLPFLTTTKQTGAGIIAAYKRAVNAGKSAYLQIGRLTPLELPPAQADFSSRGPLYSGTFAIKPDITAPGVRILSTQPAWSTAANHNAEDYSYAYSYMQGTSMSSPHMAGIAALMLQKYRERDPDVSPLEIKVRLMNSVDQLYYNTSVYESGAGFVNVYKAIHNGDSYAAVTDAYLDISGRRVEGYDFGSFSFGNTGKPAEDAAQSKKLPLTIYNTSNTASTYTFSVGYNNTSPQFSLSSTANGVSLIVSEDSVTIPGGGSATVYVNMHFEQRAKTGIYEGRLFVTNGTQTMTLPFAGRLGPSLDGVSVENAWLSRPVISTAADGIYDSLYASFAHITFDFSGRMSQTEIYVTDLNDQPVAYNGRYAVQGTVVSGTFTFMSAVTYRMFLYNGQGYDDVKSLLPDGVYKLYLQVTPYDKTYEKEVVYVSKFVVSSEGPELTINNMGVTEYPYGASTITITGKAWSKAAALCVEYNVPTQYFVGNPVIGQEWNRLVINNSFTYQTCDANGDFTISQNVSGYGRTSVATLSLYAVDCYYEKWMSDYYTGYAGYGINKSETKPIQYTETAAVTSIAGTNGLITAGLSNAPVNYTADSFAVEYSTDGGTTFKALKLTGATASGAGAASTAQLSFIPIRRTTAPQTIDFKLSYKGGAARTEYSLFTIDSSAAVYTTDTGSALIGTEITVNGGTGEAAALALLPTSGYVNESGDYEAVSIAWAWASGIIYTASTAGEYNVVGTISGGTSVDGETIDGAIIIRSAQAPAITRQPTDASVTQNSAATLSITASSPDGGALTYQWYRNSSNSNAGGTAIVGAVSSTYSPSTSIVGTTYYYVVVTNTLNNSTASVTSTAARVTVSAVSTGGTQNPSGGNPSGGNSTTVTTKDGTIVSQITVTPNTSVVGGVTTSTATVTGTAVANALAEAAKQGSDGDAIVIEIKMTVAANAQAATLGLPASSLAAIAETENASLSLDMGFASITFDTKALETIADAAGADNVSVSVSKVDVTTLTQEAQEIVGSRPVFDIHISSGGTTISDLKGGTVSISVPYQPSSEERKNPDAIVVYYIDKDGNLQNVLGRYNAKTGMVAFETGHLSQYAVAYNLVSYPDVPAWAKAAVTFTAARGIVSYSGSFGPDETVTRGEFLIALMKTYAIDVSAPKDKYAFADVEKDSELYAYAAVARELGITDGADAARNLFAPDEVVERQQIAAFFVKALNAMGKLPASDTGRALSDYADAGEVAAWAAPYVEAAVKAGLMNSTSNTAWVVSPVRMVTRSQLVQLIYNLFEDVG